MSVLFVVIMLVFKALNDKSIIDAVYTIVSYTYGPLLGMFAFGLFTKNQVRDKFIPYVAVLSPVLCFVLNVLSENIFGYKFGYELLIINGFFTFAGMWAFRLRR